MQQAYPDLVRSVSNCYVNRSSGRTIRLSEDGRVARPFAPFAKAGVVHPSKRDDEQLMIPLSKPFPTCAKKGGAPGDKWGIRLIRFAGEGAPRHTSAVDRPHIHSIGRWWGVAPDGACRNVAILVARLEAVPFPWGSWRCARDPSLRLKNGCARDDVRPRRIGNIPTHFSQKLREVGHPVFAHSVRTRCWFGEGAKKSTADPSTADAGSQVNRHPTPSTVLRARPSASAKSG